jgi:hypothetical protein
MDAQIWFLNRNTYLSTTNQLISSTKIHQIFNNLLEMIDQYTVSFPKIVRIKSLKSVIFFNFR